VKRLIDTSWAEHALLNSEVELTSWAQGSFREFWQSGRVTVVCRFSVPSSRRNET